MFVNFHLMAEFIFLLYVWIYQDKLFEVIKSKIKWLRQNEKVIV